MPQEEKYFLGAELDESELGHRRQVYPWDAIVAALGPGKAREVPMAYATVSNALKNLVKRGKIKKDEFYVMTRGDKGKRHVYLVHRGKKTM